MLSHFPTEKMSKSVKTLTLRIYGKNHHSIQIGLGIF